MALQLLACMEPLCEKCADMDLQDDKAEPKNQDEDKGIEMEGDFDGSMHDLQADPDADDQEQEEEGEQRMDQVLHTCLFLLTRSTASCHALHSKLLLSASSLFVLTLAAILHVCAGYQHGGARLCNLHPCNALP